MICARCAWGATHVVRYRDPAMSEYVCDKHARSARALGRKKCKVTKLNPKKESVR